MKGGTTVLRNDALLAPVVLRHDDLLRDADRRRRLARALPPRRRPRRGRPGLSNLLRIDAAAVRDILPVTLSVAPFGLVVGVAVATSGVPVPVGLGATPLLFGGSAQLAALELLGGGAGVLSVLATVAIINARLLLYGAALAPRFAGQPRWFRWLAPVLLVDQTYAVTTDRDPQDAGGFRRYWLTVGGVLGVGFVGAVVVGAAFGPALADLGPLRLAAPACFVALLVPRLVDRVTAAAAAVTAVVAAFGAAAPRGTGLLLGAVAGLAVAMLLEHRSAPDGAPATESGATS